MATIVGGMTQGLTRRRAAKFSFFLAVPTMAGATLLDLLDLMKEDTAWATSHNITMLILGCAIAFVVALVASLAVVFLGIYLMNKMDQQNETDAYERAIISGEPLILQDYLLRYQQAPKERRDSVDCRKPPRHPLRGAGASGEK